MMFKEFKLKPCPLCGSKELITPDKGYSNLVNPSLFIKCNCGLSGPKFSYKNGNDESLMEAKTKLFDWWNRRYEEK